MSNIFAGLISTVRLTDYNNMVLELLVMMPIPGLFCFITALVDISIEIELFSLILAPAYTSTGIYVLHCFVLIFHRLNISDKIKVMGSTNFKGFKQQPNAA